MPRAGPVPLGHAARPRGRKEGMPHALVPEQPAGQAACSPTSSSGGSSSIGVISLPHLLEWTKGNRQVTVVDPATFRVLWAHRFNHGVWPAVFTPDNRTMYAQLSYLNGFIEYDLVAGRITRTVRMPYSEEAAAMHPDE